MQNTFYDEHQYYLAHHGILGMKWGKRNGPPYPLSDAKHDRIVKKAEKRREKILKDPKKLYKHSNEFTKEEIETAISRYDTEARLKSRIPEKKKEVKLSRKQKKWAQNPASLEKHFNKFTPEQFRLAQDILSNKQGLFDKKLNQLNQPKRTLDIGIGYLDSIIRGISSFKNLKESFTNPAHQLPLNKQQEWHVYKNNQEMYNVLYKNKATTLGNIAVSSIDNKELDNIIKALETEKKNRA